MENSAIPAVFLHNCAAVVLVLLLALVLHVRWLVTLIAAALVMAGSLLWKDIGYEWGAAWQKYFYKPVLEGGLWHDSTTETEIIGLILFWLLPLGLAYATSLATIARRTD